MAKVPGQLLIPHNFSNLTMQLSAGSLSPLDICAKVSKYTEFFVNHPLVLDLINKLVKEAGPQKVGEN